MPSRPARLLRLLGACLLATGAAHSAETDRPPEVLGIAAASNLVHVINPLHRAFERANPGVEFRTSVAASGSLFAQIRQGAPFDVFLSADTDYPAQLVAAGLAPASSVQRFARGRLALWTGRNDLAGTDLGEALRRGAFQTIALAQPRTAPYGRAAEEVLARLGFAANDRSRLVVSENIAQAAQWVGTGTAEAGFVAVSLLLATGPEPRGQWQEIPADWHPRTSLDHAVVLTTRGATRAAARRYVDFLLSPVAQEILHAAGYAPASIPPR